MSFSSIKLGTNRFEVTLEKSNKNFSKKIQQVNICRMCNFWYTVGELAKVNLESLGLLLYSMFK